MKKSILMMNLFIFFVQGMESNHWSITPYGTKINLTQDAMLDVYADQNNKVDLIGIGLNQQSSLKNKENGHVPPLVGQCIIYDSGKYNSKFKSCYISEPHIFYVDGGHYPVRCHRDAILYYEVQRGKGLERFFKERAQREALKDVALCYKNFFSVGLQKLGEKKDKSIAIPMLSIDFYDEGKTFDNNGLPKKEVAIVLIQQIVDFIKNNPGAYNRMELFAEDEFEFDLYKELLIKGCKLPAPIVLLYSAAHQDSESIFKLLPRELIAYIAQLI